MDIDSLKAFLAVAKLESFTSAAKQLCLTQSAMSKRIAQLESRLDVKLFDRIGHQTRLTEAGQILLPRAEKILLDIADCQREIKNLKDSVSGSLKISTSHHIGLHRLPKILKTYKQRFPDVELNIRFQDSEEACLGVERGDTELGIVTLPLEQIRVASEYSRLLSKTIWIDQLYPVVNQRHELAKLKKPTLALITHHEAILPAYGTFTRTLLENTLAKLGVSLSSSMATNYLETIKMLVSVGLGWSVLPETLIDRELKILSIRELHLTRHLGYVQHAGHSLSNAAKALVEILNNSASASAADYKADK